MASCLSDSLVGPTQSRLSAPISRIELCQMPEQTCPSLQKSCHGVCMGSKVMHKQSGREKHSTAEEALENKLWSSGCLSFASNILNLMRSDKVPWPPGEHFYVYTLVRIQLSHLNSFHSISQSNLCWSLWRARNSNMCWDVTFTAQASLWWLSNLLFPPTLMLKHIFIFSILTVSGH